MPNPVLEALIEAAAAGDHDLIDAIVDAAEGMDAAGNVPGLADPESEHGQAAAGRVRGMMRGYSRAAPVPESADWDEDKHPRDSGKFSSKSGASGGKDAKKKPAPRPALRLPVPAEKRPYKLNQDDRWRILNDPPLDAVEMRDPLSLVPTQPHVFKDTLAQIDGPLRKSQPILVIRHGGKDYVEEGHHRLGHAIRSKQQVPALVMTADADGRIVPIDRKPAPAAPSKVDHASTLAAAFHKLDARGYNQVSLVALADATGLSRAELHAVVDDLRRKRILFPAAAEGRHGITPRERELMTDEGHLYVSVYPGKEAEFKALAGKAKEANP